MMCRLRHFTFLSLFLIKLLFVLLGIRKWLMLKFQKINSYVMFLLVSEVHAQALKGKKFEIEWDCLRLPSREGRCWCAEIFEQGTCRTVPALGLAGVAKHSRGLLWPDHLTCFVLSECSKCSQRQCKWKVAGGFVSGDFGLACSAARPKISESTSYFYNILHNTFIGTVSLYI